MKFFSEFAKFPTQTFFDEGGQPKVTWSHVGTVGGEGGKVGGGRVADPGCFAPLRRSH